MLIVFECNIHPVTNPRHQLSKQLPICINVFHNTGKQRVYNLYCLHLTAIQYNTQQTTYDTLGVFKKAR